MSEIEQAAERFLQMRERLIKNASETFGGAVVIVPPNNGGDPIELLMLDAQGSPAQFWSTVQSRIQLILETLKDKERGQAAFGGRY